MPGGVPWLTSPPVLFEPPSCELMRVYEYSKDWGPLDSNPNSEARFSLRGTHHMFYVADSLEGALWEATLRYTKFGAKGCCDFPLAKLKGQRLARVRLVRDNVKVLRLSRPELLHLFPDGNSSEVLAVSQLIATHDHASTHAEARSLLQCLNDLSPSIEHMPILSWPSRQFPKATVYLAYNPEVDSTYWELIDDPLPLDTTEGIELVRAALAQSGFNWVPANTLPTSVIDDDVE